MEQSCWKNPFSSLQFTNKAKKAILWSKIRFFRNVARFARKLLSIRILLLTHSKLVGTPCLGSPCWANAFLQKTLFIKPLLRNAWVLVNQFLCAKVRVVVECGLCRWFASMCLNWIRKPRGIGTLLCTVFWNVEILSYFKFRQL